MPRVSACCGSGIYVFQQGTGSTFPAWLPWSQRNELETKVPSLRLQQGTGKYRTENPGIPDVALNK